jgi:hypothetical protein
MWDVHVFLANLAALQLDGQDRVQDALIHLVDENIKDGYGIRTFLNIVQSLSSLIKRETVACQKLKDK